MELHGIVASKIVETYYKPCILVCFENGEEIGKGSGRSIKGIDLHKELIKCQNILNGFGGHSMAIGLNLKPCLYIDAILKLDDITKEMIQSLSLIEPIGEENQVPIFEFKNMKINSIRSLTDGKHLKLSLKTDNNTYVDAIGFNLGHFTEKYVIGNRVDVAGSLEINSFNGKENIQINIKDLK